MNNFCNISDMSFIEFTNILITDDTTKNILLCLLEVCSAVNILYKNCPIEFIAFAVGFGGIFKRNPKFIELSVLIGCFARYVIHFISGITIYAIIAPTDIAGMTIGSPMLYSVIYNGLYMLPNTVIAIVVMCLLRYPLKKLNKIGK
jgi:thiamine transporter ThiT